METSLICNNGERLIGFNIPDIFRVFHCSPEKAIYEQRSDYFRERLYENNVDDPVVWLGFRCNECIIAELPRISYRKNEKIISYRLLSFNMKSYMDRLKQKEILECLPDVR